jgi:hypothetical protein
MGVGNQSSVMSYRQNYLDLDPTYTDSFDRPMLRLTFDWQENESRQNGARAISWPVVLAAQRSPAQSAEGREACRSELHWRVGTWEDRARYYVCTAQLRGI